MSDCFHYIKRQEVITWERCLLSEVWATNRILYRSTQNGQEDRKLREYTANMFSEINSLKHSICKQSLNDYMHFWLNRKAYERQWWDTHLQRPSWYVLNAIEVWSCAWAYTEGYRLLEGFNLKCFILLSWDWRAKTEDNTLLVESYNVCGSITTLIGIILNNNSFGTQFNHIS